MLPMQKLGQHLIVVSLGGINDGWVIILVKGQGRMFDSSRVAATAGLVQYFGRSDKRSMGSMDVTPYREIWHLFSMELVCCIDF